MCKSVTLHQPTLEQLSFTRELLACPKTMAFNAKWGGVVLFPKEKQKAFYECYLTGDPLYHYFHIYNEMKQPVGEVSTRWDNTYGSFVLNIKVMAKYRGNGYARDGLRLFLEYLFDVHEIARIVDNVAIDNEGAIHFLQKEGFVEVKRTEEIILLEYTKNQHYLMKKNG